MIKHKIEYSWDDEKQLFLIVVSDINGNKELITLCDELYEKHGKEYEKLNFYFFKDRDNAADYIYLRFVLTDHANNAIENSHCIGHLINDELVGRFSPPEHLKKYDNPGKKIDKTSSIQLEES